jgi:hypothetical protein
VAGDGPPRSPLPPSENVEQITADIIEKAVPEARQELRQKNIEALTRISEPINHVPNCSGSKPGFFSQLSLGHFPLILERFEDAFRTARELSDIFT